MTELLTVLANFMAFELSHGRQIRLIEMSLGYMLSVDSLRIPYTEHNEEGPTRGLLKSIFGIPVNVETGDTELWIRYNISGHMREEN